MIVLAGKARWKRSSNNLVFDSACAEYSSRTLLAAADALYTSCINGSTKENILSTYQGFRRNRGQICAAKGDAVGERLLCFEH